MYRIFYKIGLTYKRQEYHKELLIKDVEKRFTDRESKIEHSFKEVNEFLSTFHADFTEFACLYKN